MDKIREKMNQSNLNYISIHPKKIPDYKTHTRKKNLQNLISNLILCVIIPF